MLGTALYHAAAIVGFVVAVVVLLAILSTLALYNPWAVVGLFGIALLGNTWYAYRRDRRCNSNAPR
jgi:hypothetical protein